MLHHILRLEEKKPSDLNALKVFTLPSFFILRLFPHLYTLNVDIINKCLISSFFHLLCDVVYMKILRNLYRGFTPRRVIGLIVSIDKYDPADKFINIGYIEFINWLRVSGQ